MTLSKESKISEKDYSLIEDQIENGELECSTVFNYIDLVNVYEGDEDDAYYAAYESTTDLNDDGSIDLPVSVKYIDYTNDASCYRITFQSGEIKDYL